MDELLEQLQSCTDESLRIKLYKEYQRRKQLKRQQEGLAVQNKFSYNTSGNNNKAIRCVPNDYQENKNKCNAYINSNIKNKNNFQNEKISEFISYYETYLGINEGTLFSFIENENKKTERIVKQIKEHAKEREEKLKGGPTL